MRPLWVCSIVELADHVRALSAGWVVSVVSGADQPRTPSGILPDHHLRIELDDVVDPQPGLVLPGEEHVRKLVEFFRQPGDGEPVLVHCVAGVSRSWAAAMIGMAIDNEGREFEVAQALRLAAPHAFPNRRLISLADFVLEREGRLISALKSMPPGRSSWMGPLTRVPEI